MQKFATYYEPLVAPGIRFEDESRTKQSFKDECDINNIVKKAAQNGFMPPPDGNQQYGDFSDPNDYRAAMDLVMDAQRQFEEQPSHVRARFGNDPANFLQFCSDPSNAEEMVKLGLAIPEAPQRAPEPVQAPPIPPPIKPNEK